nr:hypothetical protein C06A6.2 - Caenorhabditis elegans [Caenorhabditis elegans]
MFRQLSELYISTLKEAKERSPPNFDDTPRGLLLALIKDRPTIWNSSARLTKDDVLASFQQCSAILSNMDPGYSKFPKDPEMNFCSLISYQTNFFFIAVWAVIEKWCWVVESYVRCSVTAPPSEWRYNNTLDYLKQFATTSYPYLGCLSKKRRNELTKLYNDPEINVVMQKTEEIEFPVGIFRDEMLYLSGEDHLMQYDLELRTVGQVVNAKRRGRPSKVDKRSPVDNFYNLTPQSAQFQKLLESNMSSAFSIAFAESELIPDDLGFSPAMYMALIDMIQDKPELWQSNHPQKDNLQAQEQLFEDFGKQLIIKFRDTADISVLEKLTGPYVHLVWERLLEKFKEEDSLETVSKWKYYQVGKSYIKNSIFMEFNLVQS